MKSLLLIGGTENGDYEALRDMSRGLRSHQGGWSCLKDTKRGDEIWFYVVGGVNAIAARGVALTDAEVGDDWPYECRVGKIQWIENHIRLDELAKRFRGWGWPRYPRAKLCLDPDKVKWLRQRAKKRLTADEAEAEAIKRGAGFGDPEKNKRVEAAAIKFVRQYYQRHGYTVVSRESECVGYDLHAIKGSRELHLEVKGVAGTEPKFIITRNEVEKANEDSKLRVVVVTSALSAQRKVTEFTGKEFIKRYDLAVIAYQATRKTH